MLLSNMLEMDYLANLSFKSIKIYTTFTIVKLICNDVSFSDFPFPIYELFFGMIRFTIPNAKRTHFLDCGDSRGMFHLRGICNRIIWNRWVAYGSYFASFRKPNQSCFMHHLISWCYRRQCGKLFPRLWAFLFLSNKS